MITRQLLFKKRFHTSTNLTSFQNAHQLFDKTAQRSFEPLHHSMLNFLHQNHPFRALEIFKKEFRDLGVAHIDEVSTTLAVKACRGDPKLGCQIHGFGVTSGLDSFLSVNNSLMHMYCKAGLVDRALVVFESLGRPDIVSRAGPEIPDALGKMLD